MSLLPKSVDGRRDLARELLEHDVLVLRFGGELRGLEQALAVPFVLLDAIGEVGPGSTQSVAKAVSPLASSARICALSISIWRLCSLWKISCTAMRPMFSFTRPSPAM